MSARGAGARHGRARRVLDERVAALQRPLRVVGGEREPEPVERLRPPGERGVGAPAERRAVGPRALAAAAGAVGGRRCAALQHDGVAAERALLGDEAAPGARAQLAQVLVEPRPVPGDVVGGGAREPRQRAGAVDDRAAALALEPPGEAVQRRPRRAAVDGDGGLGGVGRRRARDGRDVVDQRPVRVVADRGDHRHPQEGDGAAQRLVAEREQVGERAAAARDDDHVHLGARGEVLQRAGDGRRRAPVLDGREGPDDPPRPAAPPQAGDDVVACLPALAGHDADAARQRRHRQPLLRREQPLGVQRAAQPVELREQVALTGDAHRGDGEGERRRRGARARVVVAAAGGDDALAVGERDRERVGVVAPHRAGQRAALVAQLEPHAGAALPEVEDLAEDLHVGERPHPVAQPLRVLAHGPWAAERRAGDAVGPAGWRAQLARAVGIGWAAFGHRGPGPYNEAQPDPARMARFGAHAARSRHVPRLGLACPGRDGPARGVRAPGRLRDARRPAAGERAPRGPAARGAPPTACVAPAARAGGLPRDAGRAASAGVSACRSPVVRSSAGEMAGAPRTSTAGIEGERVWCRLSASARWSSARVSDQCP